MRSPATSDSNPTARPRPSSFARSSSARAPSSAAWEVNEATGAERPVGFALYFYNFSTFLTRRGLYLEDLFVVEDARRRGYGKAIIRHLAQKALDEGCGRFDWSVLDWNQPAIDFYEGLGAEVLPDWRICRLSGEALLRAAGR